MWSSAAHTGIFVSGGNSQTSWKFVACGCGLRLVGDGDEAASACEGGGDEMVEVESVVPVPQSSTWWVFHTRLSTFSWWHRRQLESLGALGNVLHRSRITNRLTVGQQLETHLSPMRPWCGKRKYQCVNPRQRRLQSPSLHRVVLLCCTGPLLLCSKFTFPPDDGR